MKATSMKIVTLWTVAFAVALIWTAVPTDAADQNVNE